MVKYTFNKWEVITGVRVEHTNQGYVLKFPRDVAKNFAEDFANSDEKLCAKAVSLSVERDENVDGNALLLVSVLHPFMNIDASLMLASGKRDKILEYMNKDGFKDEIIRKIHELADSFM